MTKTIMAIAAAVMMAGCGGGSGSETEPFFRYGEPAPDAASIDSSCTTPARVVRERIWDGSTPYLDEMAVCPPDAFGWVTYDDARRPVAFHCEWRCVSYACAEGQDVRIDYDPGDAHVVAVVSGASAYCQR